MQRMHMRHQQEREASAYEQDTHRKYANNRGSYFSCFIDSKHFRCSTLNYAHNMSMFKLIMNAPNVPVYVESTHESS